jgi:diacylglycerol kinase family enzyme
LGIIPSGTQNNIAVSLDIPMDIAAAIALLRTGRRVKMDMGVTISSGSLANDGEVTTPFLELCSVGLVASLFPSADDLQHGNLTRVADFLATLVKSPPAKITIRLDNKKETTDLGHVVLVCNIPFIGRNYRISADASYNDGLLDVVYFGDLTKLELLNYVFQGVGVDAPADPRIQHYRVRRIDIDTQPAMPIMVDGRALGEGRVRIQVRRRVLTALAGKPAPLAPPATTEIPKAQNDAIAE